MKTLLGIVLGILLLWGAAWWVLQERLPSSGPVAADDRPAPGTPRGSPAPGPGNPASNQALPDPGTTVRSSAEIARVQEVEVFKPKTEPEPAPEPPPVKPNAKGEIDLSSDPQTAKFAKFLEEGGTRRREEERAARAQPPAAAPK